MIPVDTIAASVWRRAGGVIACTAEDEISLLVREAWESIELDTVSSRVWQLLEVPRTTTELVATLVREFDVSREQCRADLEPVLTALCEAGALSLSQLPASPAPAVGRSESPAGCSSS